MPRRGHLIRTVSVPSPRGIQTSYTGVPAARIRRAVGWRGANRAYNNLMSPVPGRAAAHWRGGRGVPAEPSRHGDRACAVRRGLQGARLRLPVRRQRRNNMIVPIDSRYGAYQPCAAPSRSRRPSCSPAGAAVRLHPALTNVQRLYNQQRAPRCSTLARWCGRPRRHARTAPAAAEPVLASDQTQQWQSSDPTGGGTGGAGASTTSSPRRTPAAAARHHRERRQCAVPVRPGHQGRQLLERGSFGLRRSATSTAMNARIDSLQRLLTFDTGLTAGQRRQRRAGGLVPLRAGD